MKLVKNAIIDILIPKDATLRESFAASELKKYLELMLDASVRITDESGGNDARFIIGGPERNLACAEHISVENFKNEVPGPEGMIIRCVGENTVIIAGSNGNVGEYERGTVYGVYEFLERFCSCTLAAFSLAETPRERNNLRLTRMVFRYSDLETQDPASRNEKYESVFDNYADESGELAKMTEYDSFYKNNPGYAITIPLCSNKTNFVPDKWYMFE